MHGDLRYRPVPELVAIDLPGGAGFVDALRAIWDTGDAAAPIDPRLPRAARDALFAALRPSRLVGADGEQVRIPDGQPVEEGDAVVLATSGSSGAPKGVVLTHEALLASAQMTTERLGINPRQHHWLGCLPLAHIGGLSVLPTFEAERVEQLGRSGQVSHVSLVSTALSRLDSSVFTGILLGGSRPPHVIPPNATVTYGMTETGSGVVYDGIPLDDVEVALSHSEAATAEILIRGPMLMRCYRDGDTARVIGPDGTRTWFATGDAGSVTDDGLLQVSGRLAEVIVTGGEKVWPDAVERILAPHPDVVEVAVWKRIDPEWGERVVAWVVPGDAPPSLESLKDLVSQSIGPWAAPKELVLVTELPRTPLGKVTRQQLR
jgi:O-succinylbenzoic acid--CoA ligase